MSYLSIVLLSILTAAYIGSVLWAQSRFSATDAVGVGFLGSMLLMVAGLVVIVKFG